MGDSRFYLKVEFSVYGREFKWEPSLNWYADPGECDERIARWFADRYSEAYAELQAEKFNDATAADTQNEAEEREQLARLREKYPDA